VKAARKDTNAHWTLSYSKAKANADDGKPIDLAIPTFGYAVRGRLSNRTAFMRRASWSSWLRRASRPFLPERMIPTVETGPEIIVFKRISLS